MIHTMNSALAERIADSGSGSSSFLPQIGIVAIAILCAAIFVLLTILRIATSVAAAAASFAVTIAVTAAVLAGAGVFAGLLFTAVGGGSLLSS